MKSIMISIKPEWVAKILNGDKTIEIRKTAPKCELPCRVYIYCTKEKSYLDRLVQNHNGFYCTVRELVDFDADEYGTYYDIAGKNGEVVAEFTLKEIDRYTAEFVDNDCIEDIRLYTENPYAEDIGNMYWEDIITTNEKDDPSDCDLCKQSCVSYEEIKKYIGVNRHVIPFYGWHISDLKIYDEPRELSEFKRHCNLVHKKKNTQCFKQLCKNKGICNEELLTLIRPPQSWCYVKEVEE